MARTGPARSPAAAFWNACGVAGQYGNIPIGEPVGWDEPQPKVRRALARHILDTVTAVARQGMSWRNSARRAEQRTKGAAALFTAVPSERAFALLDHGFRLAVRARPALPLFAAGQTCRFCGAPLDPEGERIHTCPGRQTRRHDGVTRTLATGFLHYGLAIASEPVGTGYRHTPDLMGTAQVGPDNGYVECRVSHLTVQTNLRQEDADRAQVALRKIWAKKKRDQYGLMDPVSERALLPIGPCCRLCGPPTEPPCKTP